MSESSVSESSESLVSESNSSFIGTVIVTVLVILVVLGSCLLDLFNNPLKHPRKYVNKRFINWFLVGLTYASTYFGRYNINVANTKDVFLILSNSFPPSFFFRNVDYFYLFYFVLFCFWKFV